MTPDDRLEPVLSLMETDAEAALRGLEDLIRLHPEDARLPFMAGSVLAGLERYAEARTAMERAVELAPDFAIARFQLGFLALTSGDPATAGSVWTPLFGLPAEHPLRLFVAGLSAMTADRFAEAISLLEAGIEHNRDLPPLNKNMMILIEEMRERLNTQGGDPGIESGAHFLLKQSSFKGTRH
jgi:tetratricopeptide (TPR) repeat protein